MLEKIAITILAVTFIYKIVFCLVESVYKGTLSDYERFRYEQYREGHKWIIILNIIEGVMTLLAAVAGIFLIVSWLVFYLGR